MMKINVQRKVQDRIAKCQMNVHGTSPHKLFSLVTSSSVMKSSFSYNCTLDIIESLERDISSISLCI